MSEYTYSQRLRIFANYLDNHPEINEAAEWELPAVWLYALNTEDFGRLCRAMGSFDKSGSGGSLDARHIEKDHDGTFLFRVTVSHSGACERKQAVNDDGTPKTRKVQRFVETDDVEPVYEWDCPESFLNL